MLEGASHLAKLRPVALCLCVAAWPGGATLAQAGAAAQDAIHWAYAAYFGTGYYDIGDLEDIYVFRAGPRLELRPAALTDDGRRAGITLRVPVALGLHDFGLDNLIGSTRFDSVATIGAVPGVEIEIPVTERWSVKPLGHLGWGSDTGGDASAWIYWAGARSRLTFAPAGDVEWALVNALTYVGYKPRGAASGHIVPFLTGLEFRRPLDNTRIGGERVALHWHVAHTRYLSGLTFRSAPSGVARLDLDNDWELGVAFGKESSKLRLWKLSWDRVGLAYQFGGHGELTGIKLVFRSLFDR